MTDVQERLLELLDEIDAACGRLQLTWFLAEETAHAALTKHGFKGTEYPVKIMMPVADIASFLKWMEQSGPDNRTIESWKENPALEQFSFRYVDTGSLLIDYSSGEYFTCPGIAVTILPLLPNTISHKTRGKHRYIQLCNADPDGTRAGLKITMEDLQTRREMKKAGKKPGSDQTGAYFGSAYCLSHKFAYLAGRLEAFYLSYRGDPEKQTLYMTRDNHWIRFDKKIYDEICRIPFEGKMYPVSYRSYFRKRYGKAWYKVRLKGLPGTERIRVIRDCHMPYEQFLEAIAEDKTTQQDLMRERRSYLRWMEEVHDPLQKSVDRTFHRVRRSVERIDCWYRLRGKREQLQEAAGQGDISALEKLLSEYLRKTDQYAAEKIGFYIDDEIFSYAKLVWEAQGRPGYADKVYSYVPDLYKKESVDAYFAARTGKNDLETAD